MRAYVLLAALAVSSCDCGGLFVPPDAGPDDDDVAASGCSAAFTTVLTALCDRHPSCPQAYPIAYRDRDECAAIFCWASTCRLESDEIDDVDHWRLERVQPDVDATRATACASYVQGASCDVLFAGADPGEATPCDGLLGGGFGSDEEDDDGDDGDDPPLPDGEPCASSEQCSVDSTCRSDGLDEAQGAYTCSTCVPLPVQGEPCGDTGRCAGGAVCRYSVDPWACTAPLASGTACVDSAECASGFCRKVGGEDWTCRDDGQDGDDCGVDADCRSYFCDATSGACATKQHNGGPCTADAQCSNGAGDEAAGTCGDPDGTTCSSGWSCASGFCDPTTTQCGPKRADGASCATWEECASGYCVYGSNVCMPRCTDDASCGAGRYCDWNTSTCLDQRADGASCEDDDECLGGRCSFDDVCEQPPGLGDPCAASYECYPLGFCDDGRCVERRDPDEPCDALDACKEPFLCRDGRCEPINLQCEPAPAGEGCAYLRVCDDGAYCDLYDGFTCKPKKQRGSGCDADEQCAGGDRCASNGEVAFCAAPADEGEPCTRATECAAGLHCVLDEATYTSSCTAGPVGQPCDAYSGDPADACPAGTYCDDDACAARVASGQPCAWYDAPCVESDYCDEQTSTCTPTAGVGETCATSYPELPCGVGLRCEDGADGGTACVQLKGTGEPCSSTSECASGACDGTFGCLSTSACVLP